MRISYLNIIMILLLAFACHKDEDISKNDVFFLEKSLGEIAKELRGVWKLHYTVKGDTGERSPYYCCTYINFHDCNSISIINSSGKWYNNEPIFWFKDFNSYKDTLGGNDTIFYMEYATLRWIPWKIKQDTLMVFDYGRSDGYTYAMTHTK